MHLDGDAVAGLRLEVQGRARADLAGGRDDAEGGGVLTAQRVRQPVALRVHGCDGRADAHPRPGVLPNGAQAVLAGREGRAFVLAGHAVGGNRFGAFATAAVVCVGDQRAQEEFRVGPHGRVAG